MLLGTEQQPYGGWDMQLQNTPFTNFQSRPQAPQQRLYQKNDSSVVSSVRRYSSSGTPTPAQQNGFQVPTPAQQQVIQPVRRPSNKSAYRSATFHQPTNTFINARPTQPNPQRPSGQLRTSSSFHGSLQSQTGNPPYSGRSSNNGVPVVQQAQKTSIYTVNGQFQAGMKDVPVWLKSLRLHKYTRMFQEMTYDEMMALNDQKLEERQVTKGARRKILQSLLKLRDRSQLIRQLEKCIDEHGDVRCLIVELRAMMHTPIAAYKPKPDEEPKPSNYIIDAIGISADEVSDENLVGLISRLTIRLHEYLFRNGLPQIQELRLEEEYLFKLLQVYDKILTNEAFTYRQRYCVNECKRVLGRYMQEQKIILGHSSPVNGQHSISLAQRQPTLVSSPSSSGYQTISPPNSSTRRNSDTNSDTNSAPASPPAIQLIGQFQQQYGNQPTLNQTCPPPGFEWPATNNAGVAPKAPNHFRPYVDNDTMTSSWYSQMHQQNDDLLSSQRIANNQWEHQSVNKDERTALMALLDSNPMLCNMLLQQLQRQQAQAKPQKPLSPIGTRPANFQPQQQVKSEPTVCFPVTVTDKLRQIANEEQGTETLEMALQLAMDQLKLHKQRSADVQPRPVLWQNVKEPVKRPTTQLPTPNNWWSNMSPSAVSTAPKAPVKSTLFTQTDNRLSNNLLSDYAKPTNCLFDPWANSFNDLSSSDQLTASTTSTSGSDIYGRPTVQNPTEGQNLLGRMMADPLVCGQSQQQQRIMRQYAAPDDLLMLQSNQNLFSGPRVTDDLRHVINEHQQKQFFDTFRPLTCSASGAVH